MEIKLAGNKKKSEMNMNQLIIKKLQILLYNSPFSRIRLFFRLHLKVKACYNALALTLNQQMI